MRVMLFDHSLEGQHNVEHVSAMIGHLLEAGDEVSFYGSRESPHLDQIRASWPSTPVKALLPERAGRPTAFDRFRELRASLRDLFRSADGANADVLHHLYLDTALVPVEDVRVGRIEFDPQLPHSLTGRGLGEIKRVAVRRAVSTGRLDGIFVHTDRIRRRLAELCGDVLLRVCTVVPDPVPPVIDTDQSEARQRLGLPAGSPIVLFFGGLRRNKGPDLFVRAISQLRERAIGVIAGEPHSVSEAEILSLASTMPDRSKLILRLGWIPQEEVPLYFAAADVVAMPYRRSFPATSGVLSWAAAIGRPIVVTDVGDVGQIVRDRGLGVTVNPDSPQEFASALGQVLTDPDRSKREVAPRARAFALSQSWEERVKAIRRRYLEVRTAGEPPLEADRPRHSGPEPSTG